MNRRVMGAIGAWIVAAMVSAGCGGKSSTSPTTSSSADEAQVASVLGAASSLTDDGLAEDPSRVDASASAPASPLQGEMSDPAATQALIRPFEWWQRVTQVTPTWTLAFADTGADGRPTTCIATLHKHMTGSLIVIPTTPADTTRADSLHSISKPLDKTLTRKIMLSRLLIGTERLWKVVEVTGASVSTIGPQTSLMSLHIHATSGVDTTIVDPLQWFSLRHVLKFATHDTVTVTATTSRTNDAVFIHRWDWRHRLRNNLDGTYSFTWVTSAWGGWRWFGIQAMSHGSIYDDTLPFDMEAWHFPFRVVGGQPDVPYYP
jgi:hypothetical protein